MHARAVSGAALCAGRHYQLYTWCQRVLLASTKTRLQLLTSGIHTPCLMRLSVVTHLSLEPLFTDARYQHSYIAT